MVHHRWAQILYKYKKDPMTIDNWQICRTGAYQSVSFECVSHLQFVSALRQLSLGLLALSNPGCEFLQLGLQFFSLVLRLGLSLLQAFHLTAKLFVSALQTRLGFLQIGLELCTSSHTSKVQVAG